MFPPEGASQQIRLEVTDLDVCLSLHNLGNDFMVLLLSSSLRIFIIITILIFF